MHNFFCFLLLIIIPLFQNEKINLNKTLKQWTQIKSLKDKYRKVIYLKIQNIFQTQNPPSSPKQQSKPMSENDYEREQQELYEFFKKRKNVINQKLKRCRQFKHSNPPINYKENTPKEELVLEHVIQFKKQFQQHIGQNRELFLYPKNQCDVYKFICTTIRPTKLGFLELYNYEECAERLSKFVQYEELDPPDEFPKCIPSPANIAKWQKGDCFDISILLCSLLIGVGYDAYCVYGIAPKEITTKNEALMECEFLENIKEKQDNGTVMEQTKKEDTIFQKKVTESLFDKKVIEDQKREQDQLARKALTIDDDEPDELTPDLFLGKRIHCWVLLKRGKRGVLQDKFIEPSTGKIYDTKNSPYLLVDAIFNHTNFFIHMQPKHKVDEIKFELYETITWEYVMLHDQLFRNTGDEEVHQLEDNGLNKISDQDEKLKYLAQTLDMPPPWSPKIYIEKDNFLRGTPLGQTTTFFIKVKVQKYADYSQPDGLIMKYTLFEDYKKIKIRQIGYFFKHRSDKLQRKYRYPYEFKTVEYYGPGKMPHWKKVTEVDRRMRIIDYYPNRNSDGLIKRIEKIGQKTIELYINRDDRLVSQSVTFVKTDKEKVNTAKNSYYDDNHVGKVCIQKMSRQFQKNPKEPVKEQIAKITVDFLKEKVVVIYHMDEGQIEPIKKEYPRDQILGLGKIDTNQKKNDDPIIQQEHQKLLEMEKQTYQSIRQVETTSSQEYKGVRNGILTIDKTLYDKARQKFKQNRDKVEDEINEDDANDYLKPFLQKRGLSTNQPISDSSVANEVKNEVMKKMKERIIARAKIIQERLQKQQDHLKQLEEQYQKKQQEKNEKELSEVKFKISILESRSSRFEAMAISKFQDMDQKLSSDPRLVILKK